MKLLQIRIDDMDQSFCYPHDCEEEEVTCRKNNFVSSQKHERVSGGADKDRGAKEVRGTYEYLYPILHPP